MFLSLFSSSLLSSVLLFSVFGVVLFEAFVLGGFFFVFVDDGYFTHPCFSFQSFSDSSSSLPMFIISRIFPPALRLVALTVLLEGGSLSEEPFIVVVDFRRAAAFSVLDVSEFGFKCTQILF